MRWTPRQGTNHGCSPELLGIPLRLCIRVICPNPPPSPPFLHGLGGGCSVSPLSLRIHMGLILFCLFNLI